MGAPTRPIVEYVRSRFEAMADPAKAGPMAAYLKTDMPFYGIHKPDRVPVFREMKKRFPPSNRRTYEANVRALWPIFRSKAIVEQVFVHRVVRKRLCCIGGIFIVACSPDRPLVAPGPPCHYGRGTGGTSGVFEATPSREEGRRL